MMTLQDYLQWAMKQPWGWGTEPGLDCCKFAAKWAILCGYVDPMVLVWRQPYNSERSAIRRISEGGGLVVLWSAGMDHVGIAASTDQPETGDIAVITRPTVCGGNEALGIYTGQRWATLGISGIEAGAAGVVKAWRP